MPVALPWGSDPSQVVARASAAAGSLDVLRVRVSWTREDWPLGTLRIPFAHEPAVERRKLVREKVKLLQSIARGRELFQSGRGNTSILASTIAADCQWLGIAEYVQGAPTAEVARHFAQSAAVLLELLTMRHVRKPAPLLEIEVTDRRAKAKRMEVDGPERCSLDHFEQAVFLALIAGDERILTGLVGVDETLYDPPGTGMPLHESASVRALRALVVGDPPRARAHMADAHRARKRPYWEWYFLRGAVKTKPTVARELLDHPYAALGARDADAFRRSMSLMLDVHGRWAAREWSKRGGGFPHLAIVCLPAVACERLARRLGLSSSIDSPFLPRDLIGD